MIAKCLIVGTGGFLGACARYLLGGWVQQHLGAGFPYGTLVVNLSGCFALGMFGALALELLWREEWRLLLAIGFLGAYTTFSTYEYETLLLIAEGRRVAAALANLAGSALAGFAAAYLGLVCARLLLHLRG